MPNYVWAILAFVILAILGLLVMRALMGAASVEAPSPSKRPQQTRSRSTTNINLRSDYRIIEDDCRDDRHNDHRHDHHDHHHDDSWSSGDDSD